MESQLELHELTANEAIREYLLAVGEGHAYEFYGIWRQFKKTTSPRAVYKNFYVLRELGLIESVRFEPGEGPIKKHLFRIVPGMEDDPRWIRPYSALYVSGGLGREYQRRLAEGLPIKKGRRPEYL